MEVMLDTSAYSAFMRGHEEIVSSLRRVNGIVLNPIVLGELLAGFGLGNQRSRNESELEDFLTSPRVRIVEIDQETAARYAAIWGALKKSGTPVPTNDLWIAANAMRHGLVLFTTDFHYKKIPQILIQLYNVAH